MSKYIPGSQKHLTLDDRIYIENSLNKDYTFKSIAKYLCKDTTTISKDIKRHIAYRTGIIRGPFTMQRALYALSSTI